MRRPVLACGESSAMSYENYKVLHIFAALLLFCALGGLAMLAWQTRGASAVKDETVQSRKRLSMIHGVALLILFVAGFGLMAKMGLMAGAWPTWIYAKLGLWLLLGASAVLVRRMPGQGRIWIWGLPLLGAIAGYLAVHKPM